MTKQVKREDCTINLQLWDTAGQERFLSVTSGFYRNSQICILVFDLTNETSFEHLERWRKEFLERLNPPDGEKFPFVLIGNKNDLKDIRKVEDDEIQKYCSSHNNMPYFCCSAQSADNVEQAFLHVADLALKRNNTDETSITEIQPVQIIEPKKEKKCCF